MTTQKAVCDCPDHRPPAVPLPVVNAAGASSLSCRVGRHDSLFLALLRRLSSQDFPELARLHARQTGDLSIALLDAWAVAADVLTFHSERYINEGYLRTATELRSLEELSRLIGYRPGPGVASSVYLAFTLEKDPKQASVETLIPKGTAVKSVAGDGELPQTFETSEDLLARAEWNAIRPRQSIPQKITAENVNSLTSLFVEGIDHQLQPNKRIFVFPEGTNVTPTSLTVAEVRIDAKNNRTELVLGETIYSLRRLAREVIPQVESLLQRADKDVIRDKLPWIESDVETPLKRLRNGDATAVPPLPPMADWNTLSQYDENLSGWLTGTGETNVQAALREFTNPTSLHYVLIANLTQSIADGLESLLPPLIKLCEEQDAFDQAALRIYGAVRLTDENVAQEVTAARNAVDAIVIPGATALPPHKQKLDRVKIAVAALDDNAGNDEKQEFINAREHLKIWWGLTSGGNLNDRADKIAFAFRTLKEKLSSDQKTEVKLQAIHDAITLISSLSPNANASPAQERLDQLVAALQTKVDNFATKIDGALPTVVDGSKILQQFNDRLLAPIRDEPNLASKHKRATELLTVNNDGVIPLAPLINVCSTLASVLSSLDDAIQERRSAFALQQAAEIKKRYGPLDATTFPTVKQAWTATKGVLDEAMRQSDTEPKKYVTPLGTTIERLGTEVQPGVIQQLESVVNDGDDVTKSRVEGLIRQLESFVARNGGSTGPPDDPPAPISGGGIGQTVDPSETGPSAPQTLVRTAGEVLAIPANAAADVVAQLTVSFGMITLEQLKAKWQAVRNGGQSAFASPLSEPLSLFGHNAPRPIFNKDLELAPGKDWTAEESGKRDYIGHIVLSSIVDLQTPTWMILRYADGSEDEWHIKESRVVSRNDYGLTLRVTRCDLDTAEDDWRGPTADETIGTLRTTLAIVPTRHLKLSEAPLSVLIGKEADKFELPTEYDFAPETDQIELDGIYLSIQAGQFVIIEGERREFPGVISRELRRVKFVQHRMRELPADKVHTRIFLDDALQHTYLRHTVVVYANVVHATHGESISQIIGSGDAGQAFQQMPLAKAPLTYLAAATPSGVESTLQVRVGQLLWREQQTLLESSPTSRDFVTLPAPNHQTRVQFGDGITGARLPTGRENVHARYRVGLGKAGNVKAGAISQLANRPLGVKEVINPLPATGGADPEQVSQIRGNAPLAVMALDRLVSVRDYADFARNYAGIDKAAAVRLQMGNQPTVHITIAGADDIPIAENSDLFRNLSQAYAQFGDPFVSIQLGVRELLLLFLSAKVRLEPDYAWEFVEPKIREALYEAFSFARRELAQDVYLSEIQTAMQDVEGVAYVDVDALVPVSQSDFAAALDQTQQQGTADSLGKLFQALRDAPAHAIPSAVIHVDGARIEPNAAGGPRIRPAQLAYLSREVPDSLFLSEIR